ncbi:MAG: transposase [Nitrospira sp. SB0662_bin_26]|nr:transposase [Nitrospira sp. SB0662_bin_26]
MFNARLWAECLDVTWFLSMHDSRDRIGSGRQDDNTAWPHSALGNLTPRAFARQAHEARKIA